MIHWPIVWTHDRAEAKQRQSYYCNRSAAGFRSVPSAFIFRKGNKPNCEMSLICHFRFINKPQEANLRDLGTEVRTEQGSKLSRDQGSVHPSERVNFWKCCSAKGRAGLWSISLCACVQRGLRVKLWSNHGNTEDSFRRHGGITRKEPVSGCS